MKKTLMCAASSLLLLSMLAPASAMAEHFIYRVYEKGSAAHSGGVGTGTPGGSGATLVKSWSLSADSLNFGSLDQGSVSAPMTVVVSNTGTATLALSEPQVTAGMQDFTLTEDCAPTLQAKQVCTLSVAASPAAAGARSGTLSISSDAEANPRQIALSAYGNMMQSTLSQFTMPTKAIGDAAFDIVAPQSNSTGSFSYNSSNPAVASIAGSRVSIVSAGTTTITATQAAAGQYASNTISAILNVSAGVTWNRADTGSGTVTFSPDSLTATVPAGSWVRATTGKSTGQWYWEIVVTGTQTKTGVGVATAAAMTAVDLSKTAATTQKPGYVCAGGFCSTSAIPLYAYNSGDVLGFALDADKHLYKFYLNGVYKAGVQNLPAAAIYPVVGGVADGTYQAHFGAGSFVYPAPAGYLPLQ